MEIAGRSAVVTGGAGGLGSATVRRLVGAGMKVVIFDRVVNAAAALATELGPDTIAVTGDTTDDDAVQAAIVAAQDLGRLTVVVNVAGGGVPGGRTVGRGSVPHDWEAFVVTIEMNVMGTFNVCRLAASAMADNEPDDDNERGVFVNVGSIAGIEGQAGQIAYGTAKAGVLGMTLPMARDLAPIGIRVCAIAPGTIGTPLMLSARESTREKLTANIIHPHRFGKPEEFGELVEMIARNSYLNGENIRLDGALRFPPK
jgi:NAD(P)-dependent dehydrogenase (short-subunit alcohol dehydrogenase family)